MDLDLNLREEAPSHGPSSGGPATAPQPASTTTSTASSSTSTATREALDEELASRSVTDDQRARYGAFSAAAPGEGPSDAAQRAAAAFQASTYGTAPGDQPAVDTTAQKTGELSAGPSATAERMPVPLQPRPTPYGQFQAGGGTSGLGVPLRPAAGKARSNSWSYPASAVAPYALHPYVASTAGASGIGTGMPAPGPAQPRANRTTSYRQRGGSLSFSSPEEAMRQQYLQQQQAQQQQQGSQMFLPYAPPQPTSQPQPMMAQDSSFLGYGGGGGVGDGGGFLSAYQQQSTQPVAAAQSTPPLPTTPSSFIRRTSLPQTYLHTIPISRSASSGFTPASTDTALPILAQPQTTEVHQKLEIPTHGARALPKEIATHPAIQSITKSQSDSQQATGEAAAEKEVGVEITGEEGGGVQPSEGKFVDISEYLNLPQSKVAKTLGIPSSTLSKRWKEAARARKWPWRTVCKIDKEIMALLHNIPPSVAAKGPEHVPPEIHTRLLALLKQRQDELKPVIIRL